MQRNKPRIGILVVAYNAVGTLASVLDRIPASFRPKIDEILVCDDHSDDSTYLVGLGYKEVASDLPIRVIRHPRNLGYGGNQKAGYRLAIELGLDIVVLLHGDGQYAPECIADLVGPLQRNECEAVLGSRMMEKGSARRGGMPFYKYVGNRILTRFQNAVVGTRLTEYHSGYRAYKVSALATIPFDSNSDGFNFDTQVIVQLHDAGLRIKEVPIPTYYGDEICYVNGLRYARDVSVDVLRYRLGKLGFASGALGSVGNEYQIKASDDSSHGHILERLRHRGACRVLDLGCSSGRLAERLRAMGHHVTGVDISETADVTGRLDRFFVADLDDGIPEAVGTGYDVVVAADVIEHVRDPAQLLFAISKVLADGGTLIASVPNFAHWYPRVRTALGLFDYDQRGILDRGHVRFFTRRSFVQLVQRCGFEVTRSSPVGLPFEALTDARSRAVSGAASVDRVLAKLRPTLFAYQFVFDIRRSPHVTIDEVDMDRGVVASA